MREVARRDRLFVGTSGVFFTDDHQRQQRAAFWLAGPSLGITWVVGFVLAWARNISTLTPWIVGAMLLSLISINAVLYTRRETRPRVQDDDCMRDPSARLQRRLDDLPTRLIA